jgi:magnesium chelatase family protein
VKKEGHSFDLPIALSMIACQQERELPFANEFCFLGELALTGAVRPVRGVLPVAIEARKRGRKKLACAEGGIGVLLHGLAGEIDPVKMCAKQPW